MFRSMFPSIQIALWVSAIGLVWAAARLEAGPVVLLDSGADQWYYLDDGSDQSTTWREESFDPALAEWMSGPAPLGYGSLGAASPFLPFGTTVSYGDDASNKFATTYFRRTFNVDAADLAGFTFCTVGLLRDDAAAVYLNGVEIYRDASLSANAPFDELASGGAVGGDNERTFFEQDFLHTGLLHEGANVVAVEVHQTSITSSDIGMDLRLTGRDDAINFGSVSPGIFAGFEEAAAGAMSFTRGVDDTELEWDMPDSGATQIASVVDDITDSDDPNNTHQFHLNNVDAPVQLTTEKIDLAGYTDVQASIDLRTWLATTSGFENDDTFAVSLSTSTDGFTFTTTPWLQFAGAELKAMEDGVEKQGSFTTFTSDLRLVSGDVLSMRLVIDAEIDSGNEHLMFDNLRVTGVTLSELTWDGSSAVMWGQMLPGPPPTSHWIGGDTDSLPGNSTLAIVNSGAPIIDQAAETYRLQVNGGGVVISGEESLLTVIRDAAFADGTSLSVGAGRQLAVGGRLDFGTGGSFTLGANASLTATTGIDVAAGTTLGMGSGASIHTGAGTIGRLSIDGDATVDNSGDLAVTTLAAGATAGTLVKQGDGTLLLDNSAAATGSVSLANMALRIEAGTLASKGADPLGGSTSVTLAGGSLALEHDADVTLANTTLALAADSELTANTPGQLSFAGLTANLGTLTIGGTAQRVRFGATILDPGVGVAELGFDTAVNTFPGMIDADSATLKITKSGTADLVLDRESIGMDNATFAVGAGRLVALHGPNPLSTAAVELDGGELVLSAKPGSTTPIAYDTPVTVVGDSTLAVGATDGGSAGPMDVVLGSTATGLTLSNGMLAVRITDGYTLSLPGPVAGAGGLDLVEGQLTMQQTIDVGSLTLTGGTLVLGGDVRVADALTLTGVSLDMTGRKLYTGSATDVTIGGGQTLTIENQNLSADVLDIAGTLVRGGGDVFVNGGLTLSGGSLDMTGSTLHTTIGTDIRIAAGQTLTLENQNLMVEVLDLAGTLVRGGTGGDLVVDDDLILSSTLDMTGSTLLTRVRRTNVTVNTGGELTVDHVLGVSAMAVAGTVHFAGAYGTDLEVSDGGAVYTSGTMVFDSALITGGEVHLDGQGDLVADIVVVADSLVDTGDNRVIANNSLTLGDVAFTVTGGTLRAGGADLLNLPATDLTVTAIVEATAELSSPNDEQILGDLSVQDGVRTLTLASTASAGSTAYHFGNVTAADGLTVDGTMSVAGTFATGDRIGTVTVGTGELALADSATFDAKVSLATAAVDLIEVSADGTLQLGGTLAVTGIDRTGAGQWATVTRRIVNGTDGTIGDAAAGTGMAFDAVTPAPGSTKLSHVGGGAFLRNVNYVPSDDAPEAVDLELFIALGGDSDGDKKVWLSDWAALRAHFGNTGSGMSWTDGNFDPWVDDKVWLSDWAALRANFGNSDYTAAEGGMAAVPEPGTLAMLLGGLAGLAVLVLRRRK